LSEPENERNTPWVRWCLIAVLAIGAVAYVYVASLHEARTDEAVFGRASLEILDGDIALHHWRVMKPFMVYYAQALGRLALGDSAFVGRLPGILATLLCLWLLFRVGRRWFDEKAGLVAAALMTLSPYVLFNFPTGRADALALVFVLAAIELGGRNRVGWAGFAYALAFCTRQLVALSFPLVMAVIFFAGYLADGPGVRYWRNAGRRLWRFALGTLAPLIMLGIWSLNTKIPFAWLVNEFKSDKYETGMHLTVTFQQKLIYWLERSLDFFGLAPLSALALVLVAATAVVLVAGRALGRWRGRERPDMALAAMLSVFVLFFYLVNSLGFFTMYLRFLVPIVPWVMLIVAVLLVATVRWIIARQPKLKTALPVILVVGLGAAIVIPAASYARSLAVPIAEDDIPPLVRWVEKNAKPGAVLFTSDYGPEVDYASWGTRVGSKQFDRDPDRFRRLLPNYLGRELFLYLDARDAERWRELLPSLLSPHFELTPTGDGVIRSGTAYLITVRTTGGVDGDHLVTLVDGEFKREPFDCDVLARLLSESFAQGRKFEKRPVEVDWSVCVADIESAVLAWTVTGIEYKRIAIARAEFAYDMPRLDWRALAIARRLVVREAQGGRATFHLATSDLADFVQRKNKNLRDIHIAVSGARLVISAVAVLPLWQPRVEIAGLLQLDDQTLRFVIERATIDGKEAPDFAVNYAESVMNPILKADLSVWALRLTSVSFKESDGGWIILRASVN